MRAHLYPSAVLLPPSSNADGPPQNLNHSKLINNGCNSIWLIGIWCLTYNSIDPVIDSALTINSNTYNSIYGGNYSAWENEAT